MKADAVFEGGGVKGIAFIGALRVMEENGYRWERVAGTSAGSIVAALISAGYSSDEMLGIFRKLDTIRFLRQKGFRRVPLLGQLYGLLIHEGMYPGDAIEQFVEELLHRKGIHTFGDLPGNKLRIVASDITAGKMLILPDDLVDFDIDPVSFPIARAVRMSSSIPFFFQPALVDREKQVHCIVDGSLLSNYPVWLFDVPEKPRWPTFGFRLHDMNPKTAPRVNGLFAFSRGLILTMLDAHDRFFVEKSQAVRTIFIQTRGVRTTQFKLTEEMREQLVQSGEEAARKFLKKWDFDAYIRQFRKRPR